MRGLNEVMGRRVASSSRVVALALSVVLVGAIAACTPDPGPTPTPTPTFSCTATAGQCTPQQAEKEIQAAKDHAAAKVALQDGLAEFYALYTKKGRASSTVVLDEYLAEDELDSAIAAVKRFRATDRVGHGSVRVATMTYETEYPKGSQKVTVCEDGTEFYTTDLNGKDPVRTNAHLIYTATLKMLDGRWKRTQSTESVKVASCDA